MQMNRTAIVAATASTLLSVGTAGAAEILVTSDIAVSTTWTADNTYNLQQQIFVLPGATLTIEPGTVIASTTGLGGSLAVCRGAKIDARGTQADPIIFTSKADVATWTNGDSKTGAWRASANEWGNLTIMGRAYIGKYGAAGSPNTATPNAANDTQMEGLVAAFAGDPNVRYGGGNDSDDSGTLSFVSLRYGGKVIGLGNELNGLSLGGIGGETVIDHIEIMNNVDDGIEIWGGTVNLNYFSIWNVGDDSFDIDQGWRGKAQFGLIVQGYSVGAAQGSGVGDNCIETDGAERSDAQPVTTGCCYNLTVIGQPISGDHATAWRDNARMQYRNSIFMDLGEQLVRNDNDGGEGQGGFGFNGTLTFPQTWSTEASFTSPVNPFPNPGLAYRAQQVPGKLAEIRDSVMVRNLNSNAYTGANTVGVFGAGNDNIDAGSDEASMPIAGIVRGEPVTPFGSLVMLPVISLDPRAVNAAATSVSAAPSDGFFVPANYRGAFSPTENWLCNWTAADAFGFSVPAPGGCEIAGPCPADLNGDGNVNAADLSELLGAWGTAGGDVDGNGSTDAADLAVLLGAWGVCN
ncbi:MAG: hypothetical protein RIS86_2257 [Planctomycetota bacterium]